MQPVLIPDPLAGSESLIFLRVEISRTAIGHRLKDLGSVAYCHGRGAWLSVAGPVMAPADLFRKGPSCKRQASSLTGDKLDGIGIYRRNL